MIKFHLKDTDENEQEMIVEDVICNCCGKHIPVVGWHLVSANDGVTFEEWLHIKQQWGCFSNYESQQHDFDICENCYKKWINSFRIPIESRHYEINIKQGE